MVGGGGKAADHQVRRRTPIPLESVMKATGVESPDSAYQCCLPASRRRHGHIHERGPKSEEAFGLYGSYRLCPCLWLAHEQPAVVRGRE